MTRAACTPAFDTTSRDLHGHDRSPRSRALIAPPSALRAGLCLAVAAATALIFTVSASAAQVTPLAPTTHASGATTVSGPTPTVAAVNPAFTAYLRSRTAAREHAGSVQQSLGLLPSPIDFSFLKSSFTGSRVLAYPSSFDLRGLGRLSAVEDQGQHGTCWAFAAMGSLESCLLPSDPETFSEDNLVLNDGFDPDPYDGGGNSLMASADLARWAGPVASSEDAYGDDYTPAGLIAEKHVQDVLYLPARGAALDNDAIKSALISYGAVYTTLFADAGMCGSTRSAAYNPATAAYCYSGSAAANHAVDIVGWDDSYSRDNFSTRPAGDGAFIVRNSWGTGWGRSGYFYVSYYDARVGYQGAPACDQDANAVFCDAEPTGDFSDIYQYDTLGWTQSEGYGSDTAWFANDYTAHDGSTLSAVGFYAAEPGSSYTVYAATGAATLTAEASGSFSAAGYHTVTFTTPVQLTADQGFEVAVQLTTPGYDYPIPLETAIAGYSSAAMPSGQSFVSSNGTGWYNLTNANVCLKAFTSATGSADLSAPGTSVSGADTAWHRSAVTLTFAASDSGSSAACTEFSVGDQGWRQGSTFTIAAPKGHSNDGVHTVVYRSVDHYDVGQAESCQVKIDTLGPVCRARDLSVQRGHSCKLPFAVTDNVSPKVTCRLVLTTKSGAVVKRWSWGSGAVTARGCWWSTAYRCGLARGTYRIRVYGKDLAGNAQSVIGKASLHVT